MATKAFRLDDRVRTITDGMEAFARVVKILCGGSLYIFQWEEDGTKSLPLEPDRFELA